MTVEGGAVAGDLELCTALSPDNLEARVRYAGADEWYAVTGSPAPRQNLPAADHPTLHRRVLRLLTTPGPLEHGNEIPVGI